LRNADKKDDNILIALYKLLSPEHLLKLPFVNDSNSLDKTFYTELLHLIGLTETKEGSKKLIQRKKAGERNSASLIESAIFQLDNLDKISRLDKPSQFGATNTERLFNVALELSITWINRILFLKLLEAQLIKYHKGDQSFAFLNIGKVQNFDDLNNLFFSVLARQEADRNEEVKKQFANVPYLNSSLFEPTGIEHACLFISQLKDMKLPLLSSTVIKNNSGQKRTGELLTIEYIFEFLNAYDFASEGSEEIQEENKRLINASVLGLIFEKINGYKDGSFFTPGFITMYMCRETIRRAVVQKFNEALNSRRLQPADNGIKIDPGFSQTNYQTIDDVYNSIGQHFTKDQANDLINSLKICDPAVGSGHFLVSALNEMIAIKSELKILRDREGKTLRDYHVTVENDELIVTDDDGGLFEYNPKSRESQRIQETLFHEKQTIIENCLFGVDINPNSVKICRLRLWIELLKNAYYTQNPQSNNPINPTNPNPNLETLPNIDINIKCGNSLISRYALDADIKKALKNSKWTIDSYRLAVMTYRNAQSKEEKRAMEKLIAQIKNDFESDVAANDKRVLKLNKAKGELFALTTQTTLFDRTKTEKAIWDKQVKSLTDTILSLETELEGIRSNKIYENAFEWRFEFPEVLNEEGGFVGFDVVIGNPPYIRQEEFSNIKNYLQTNYQTYAGTADLYVYFVERGLQITKSKGNFIYILPNKWMRAGYGTALRKWIYSFNIFSIIDFGDLPVFDEAITYPCLWQIDKNSPSENSFMAASVDTLNFSSGMKPYIDSISVKVNRNLLSEGGWSIVDDKMQSLLVKIKNCSIPLKEYVNKKIFYGIKTGFNEAFVIDEDTKIRLVAEDPQSAHIIKPFLAGRDIKRYLQPKSDKYLIFTRRGIEIEQYPSIINYLHQFKNQLEPKPKEFNGKEWIGRKPGSYKWYEIQDAVDYFEEFEKKKILWPGISQEITSFAYDQMSYYGNDNNQMIISSEKFLLAILNSKVSRFFLKNTCDFVQGGFARLKIAYVEQIPICNPSNINKEEIEELVDQILSLKSQNFSTDTAALESEIDRLVYQLYGLTEEEIKIVEGR
jgi:hypothetical protein